MPRSAAAKWRAKASRLAANRAATVSAAKPAETVSGEVGSALSTGGSMLAKSVASGWQMGLNFRDEVRSLLTTDLHGLPDVQQLIREHFLNLEVTASVVVEQVRCGWVLRGCKECLCRVTLP